MTALAEQDFNVLFDEAIRFLRQKVNLPSKTWRDIEGRAHDRAFVVAGAMKEGLLADLKSEIMRGLEGKATLADFSKAFDEIVARHGWAGWTGEGSEAGRAWRTRVIFETNLKTAYAAGRYAQMTDPKLVKVHRWWRYRHAYYREPERARPQHVAFDGRVLAWDDPWWNAYYPPNGWNCSCGVETLTDEDLRSEDITAEESPPISTRTVIDPKTGAKTQVPTGIDFGWDHAPGRDWSQGLVPRELQEPLQSSGSPSAALPLPPLSDVAKPFHRAPLPETTPPEEAVAVFLNAFRASWDAPVMFRDAAGHAIPISKSLFVRGDGRFKGASRGRHLDMGLLAETVKDPDEIWVDWTARRDTGAWMLVRRYLRAAPDGLGFGSFSWTDAGWEGSTVFSPTRGGNNRPDPEMLERQRRGAMLYRRKK